MIEVEIKVSIKNKNQTEEKLQQIGFEKRDLVEESDVYFDKDRNALKSQDMALRIRSCKNLMTNTTENFMTYKGPKMDDISMTRKELEMKIENAEIGKEILRSLGYEWVYPVKKLRQYFCRNEMTACLDSVENLGEFLELEIVLPQENEKEAALNEIISLLRELGYEQGDIIRTSYLSMLHSR
ncbi:MAG: class IV adenylate cyclase [Lachnospiraceae bacterium]|nr:class IV adenylate cyclase [Lachnospiraceae bacterium]